MAKPLGIIVEDDVKMRNIFSKALQNDFEIETFEDGYTAVQRLQEVLPAIVLLDLNLPKMSGGDVIARIKADERLNKVPIVLVTADFQQAKDLNSQSDIVLIKPVSPIQLLEVVKRICKI